MKNIFKIDDGFWNHYLNLVSDVMLPYQYAVLNDALDDPDIEKSHSIENFKIAAGESDSRFYGMVFQDSDTAKWLEAVAYSLMHRPDAVLEQQADEIIDLIGRAQQPDGYLNTYFTVEKPDGKWKNLQEGHELYCSGHMIEAAIAYYEATGKTALLDIVKKNADLICSIFGEDKTEGIPGHPEIELALVRLYRTTGDARYLHQAEYFINQRGKNPAFYREEKAKRDFIIWGMDTEDTDYSQMSRPVREEANAVGHSVRAVYLYTGMAMAARETGDSTLISACQRMWNSIVTKRMYLTGGIGSSPFGESFTMDYDLPNDTAYNETCASIALMFFAREMAAITHDASYIDVMEQALYNTVLAGIQLDGTHFFYTNPLEADPYYAKKLPELRHIYARRPKWHACACCPPNAARLIASLDRYSWHISEETCYSDLFIGGTLKTEQGICIETQTGYPFENTVTYQITETKTALRLAIRIPAWSRETAISINEVPQKLCIENGYAILDSVSCGDKIVLTLDLSPRKVYSNLRVAANLGKCALMAGPLVYCFEDTDNQNALEALLVDRSASPFADCAPSGLDSAVRSLHINGFQLKGPDSLYSTEEPSAVPQILTAIPYYAWGNRETGKMKVWMPQL